MIKKTPQKSYSEKLKDPRWQKKRLFILERDEWVCQCCYNDEITLHVHHMKYMGENPWECDDKFLITLCEHCHEQETQSSKMVASKLHKFLNTLGFLSKDILWEIDKIESIKHNHISGVVLSAWMHTLSNEDAQQKMVRDYLDFIKNNPNKNLSDVDFSDIFIANE